MFSLRPGGHGDSQLLPAALQSGALLLECWQSVCSGRRGGIRREKSITTGRTPPIWRTDTVRSARYRSYGPPTALRAGHQADHTSSPTVITCLYSAVRVMDHTRPVTDNVIFALCKIIAKILSKTINLKSLQQSLFLIIVTKLWRKNELTTTTTTTTTTAAAAAATRTNNNRPNNNHNNKMMMMTKLARLLFNSSIIPQVLSTQQTTPDSNRKPFIWTCLLFETRTSLQRGRLGRMLKQNQRCQLLHSIQ